MMRAELQTIRPAQQPDEQRREKEVDALEAFLDDELSFAQLPPDLNGPGKLALYQEYMASGFDIESWKSLREKIDPASIVRKESLDDLSGPELESLARFFFNKFPKEIQARQLTTMPQHLGMEEAGTIDEFIDEAAVQPEQLQKLAQLLLDAGGRREQLLKKDFAQSRAPLFGIGYHVSQKLLTKDEVRTPRRGAVESFESDKGWMDTTGNKFVSTDPKDLYPGKFLYLTELHGGMTPVPGHATWLASAGNIPVRKAIPLTPAVMDHFGLAFNAEKRI